MLYCNTDCCCCCRYVTYQVGKPVTEACLEGYNGTIFCYGQVRPCLPPPWYLTYLYTAPRALPPKQSRLHLRLLLRSLAAPSSAVLVHDTYIHNNNRYPTTRHKLRVFTLLLPHVTDAYLARLGMHLHMCTAHVSPKYIQVQHRFQACPLCTSSARRAPAKRSRRSGPAP